MNGKIKKLVFVFLALVLPGSQLARPAATSAQGNVFTVSPHGSPNGNGSPSSPWDLETALNQPPAVGPGAYITVRGQPGERAILVTPSDRPALQFANTAYVIFQDLEITGPDEKRTTSRDESAYGIQVDQGSYSHHIKLVNSIIHDSQSQGIAWWQALVDADLAVTSIHPGQAYELRNVQDYFGDVVEGTFDGSTILLPMQGHSVARPNGLGFEPDSTFPEFGAFVLILK